MKAKLLGLVCCLIFSGFAGAATTVGGVLNNASFLVPPLPGSAIAQGSIFSVFGTEMGPTTLASAPFPLLTSFGGTTINISITGATPVQAFLLYTSATQLAAVMPSNARAGTGTISVTYNGQTSAPFPITVAANGFGALTLNGIGTGPGIITDANYVPLTQLGAANPGQPVILWGTGLGPVPFPDNQGAQALDLRTNAPNIVVEVFVGLKPANVRYAGRAPGFSGLDQIVFDIPNDVTPGCYVSVVLRANGVISNYISVPVASSGRVCSDSNGFSNADLAILTSTGKFRTGSVVLGRASTKTAIPGFGTATATADIASAGFYSYDASNFVRATGNSSAATIGSCTVITFSGGAGSYKDPFLPTPLNAGSSISVAAPTGTKNLDRQANGTYAGSFGTSISGITLPPGITLPGFSAPFLEPGPYTVTGPGGSDVGSFTARLTVAGNFAWTNQDAITSIVRQNSLDVTWSAAGDYVTISGFSLNGNVGASFYCTEVGSAGHFTIPALVLASMPVSSQQSGVALGSLGVSSYTTPVRFTASGLDSGVLLYTNTQQKTVSYQ